jgi:hypothetical protein
MMREKNTLTKTENEIKHHIFEYLLLVTSGIFFIVFLAIFKGQHSKQFIIASLFILYLEVKLSTTEFLCSQTLRTKLFVIPM